MFRLIFPIQLYFLKKKIKRNETLYPSMKMLREYIEFCRVSKAELKQNGGERKEGGKGWAKLERN